VILTQEQVNNQLNQNYQLSEIRTFFWIAKNIEIFEKDLNKVEIKTETNDYEENFNFKLTWKDEVDIEINNVLNDYNPVKVFAVEADEPMRNRAYMNCSQIMLI